MIDYKDLRQRLNQLVEKKIKPAVEEKTEEIHAFIMEVIREEYSSSTIMSQWDSITTRLSEKELANPIEIPSNTTINNNEVIINLRDDRVNRTFRALELYGDSPFQKVKDRLRILGTFSLKTIR